MAQSRFPLNLLGLRELRWQQVRDMLRFVRRRLDEDRLPQVAGSLTFTTVLALVPMLTIAFAIFTTFPLFNTFRASLEAYFIKSLMPKTIANTILGYLSQFAAKATRLSAVGAVALIVTAVAMMNMIDRVLNHIWRVKAHRPLAQRILVYWAIITLGPLLVGVSMTVTTYLFTATTGVVGRVPFIGVVFYTLVSMGLTMGAFTLLYAAVPNRVVDWRDAAWGGLVASIAFEIAKRIFAAFIAKFPSYTVVYGALAALPIFLVWIYVSWLITLVGAVIAASLPVVKYERWWHVATPGSAFVDAMAVLGVLHRARTHDGSAAVDADMIRSKTRLGFDESETLLQKMLDAGWVGRMKTDLPKRRQWTRKAWHGTDSWILLANPQRLKLADVYRLFMFDPAGNPALARQVESAIEQGLDQTLTAHFASGTP
ncbi:MAG TPA: YihY family inner membrane protein [Burkholderiaceae bacterium]|jgi:membrane protein|nr:YihY family inner membrane protein [Burkholderiaceae bacterium]